MKEKKKINTIRKIQYKNKESFFLIIRGLEVGIAAGLVAVFYRFLLEYAEKYLNIIISTVKDSPSKIALWFIALAALGGFVAMLNKIEPMASGSGIPQVTGEVKGVLTQNWWRVLLAKIVGGTVCVFSGLSLGREGPSVQLGGMAAKGIARATKADKTTELRMISCGAGAGMAAAFNAPLAGTMFVLEEIHHTFDKSLLCMGIVSSITADYISKLFFGQNTVFNYDTVNFPLKYYWLLIIMGFFLGLCGCAYNVCMGKAQDLYKKIKIPNYIKLPIVFVFSGVIGLVMPQILCGGHSMEVILLKENPSLTYLIVLLTTKFLFGAICFASGAPGGTLYPLCILGAYMGAIFGTVSVNSFSAITPAMWEEFVVIGMAGLFASIVRSPITGIVLVFELTGNMNNILPLAVVSLISYATANFIGVTPFYEYLFEKIVSTDHKKPSFFETDEKVLETYTIPVGSPVAKKKIMDVDWGKHCVVVSVERNGVSITPKGDTVIKEGDEIVVLVSQRRFSRDIEKLERMIKG